MAKMKVHELAKELDKKSKELVDFLQAKGYDVKVAQSSIEDEAITLVRKAFASGGDVAAPPKEAASAKEPAAETKRKQNLRGEDGCERKEAADGEGARDAQIRERKSGGQAAAQDGCA